MTDINKTGLRQLEDAGSRLAFLTAASEHVLRRVEGVDGVVSFVCSCGEGFSVSGDARARAKIEHDAHLYSTVVAAKISDHFEWLSKAAAEFDAASPENMP